MKSVEGSPFDCGACSDKDREARNCFNTKSISEEAIAVTEYTGPVIEELRERNIPKVLSLGGIRLYECPLSYITDETIGIIRVIFLMDETGHLFFSGGWVQGVITESLQEAIRWL